MLLLDAEAISALAHGSVARRARVRAIVAEARLARRPVATVAAVLAEVTRGRPADTAVFSCLKEHRVEVHPVDRSVGVRAGRYLGALGAGSELAVDAFVVALADLAGGALIVTADPSDLRRLCAHAEAEIRVLAI